METSTYIDAVRTHRDNQGLHITTVWFVDNGSRCFSEANVCVMTGGANQSDKAFLSITFLDDEGERLLAPKPGGLSDVSRYEELAPMADGQRQRMIENWVIRTVADHLNPDAEELVGRIMLYQQLVELQSMTRQSLKPIRQRIHTGVAGQGLAVTPTSLSRFGDRESLDWLDGAQAPMCSVG